MHDPPDDSSRKAQHLDRSNAELASVRYNWNRLASTDPLWAVLTRADKRGGRWQTDEFLATGEEFVAEIRGRFEELGVRFGGERALDFGCGAGRLTRAMTQHFHSVVGLDIAEQMLEVARRVSSDPKIRYLHTPAGDLAPVAGDRFDLVASYITLQHVPPSSAHRLVTELCAVVGPQGLLFLQIPTESRSDPERLYGRNDAKGLLRSLLPTRLVERYREWRVGSPRIDMFGLPRSLVEDLLARSGLVLLAADDKDDTLRYVPSLRYFAQRRGIAPISSGVYAQSCADAL